ncbi:MAG: RIP metalloprotease RseP [Firmicutes bacterium]|nr:RIP metalloprotease RseP [Bacillota bacterium]
MLTAIYAILIFCLIIFVHEFGHFAAAKACGIRVNEFALGMGPRLIHHKGKETEFSLRLLPIGGYNKIEGEDEDSDDPRAFNNASVGKRILVVVAGALMNFLTCIVILIIVYGTVGFASTTIGETIDGLPAAEAGLEAGDTILSIDGKDVNVWTDVQTYTQAGEDALTVVVLRDGKELTLTVPLVTEDGRKVMGIRSLIKHDLGLAIREGFTGTWSMAKEMYQFVGGLFVGKGSLDDVAGPVGIVSVISEQAKTGFLNVLYLTAIISLNLGIINLLPLPALDGGRLVFLLINLITGKKVSTKVEGTIHGIGMILLLALMAFILVKDVLRLIG